MLRISMVGSIIDWADEKIINASTSPLDLAKAAGLGFVEGCIDGMVITWPILVAAIMLANKNK